MFPAGATVTDLGPASLAVSQVRLRAREMNESCARFALRDGA